jgi:L-asparaginase / beta-aspartyl-peptidase
MPRSASAPLVLAAALALVAAVAAPLGAQRTDGPRFALVIHGGGGVSPRSEMTPELEAEYRAALAESLRAGHAVLREGGTALDAVEAAIRVMEDSPLFNAGRGSSFNLEGYNELDASIMDGRTLDAGAVAVVKNVRNPITLARLVMEQSPHVLMAADGAERFARGQGLEPVPPHYFWTERRWEALQRRIEQGARYGEPVADAALPRHELFGTVGAAALDAHGNLAAGTSTGGRVGKLPGRVGDSPIIGAGTYADNATAALSSTGLGEYVLRVLGTKSVTELMAHRGMPLDEAMETVRVRMAEMGGSISMIGVDATGHISMRYSGHGMYRGYVREDGRLVVHIWEGDPAMDPKGEPAAAALERARALGAAGRQEEAAAVLRDAIRAHPLERDIHFRLGYVLRYAGLFEESIASYRRGLELDGSPTARVSGEGQIAKSLVYLGDYAGALTLQEGLHRHLAELGEAADEKMHFYEGIMHLHAGDTARAISRFDAAVAADSGSLWSAFGRAYRYAARGDTARLAALARELAGRDVADGERHYRLVHFHALAGEPEAAVARLRAANEAGFFAYPYIRQDPLTRSLRDAPGYAETLAAVRARHEAFRAGW